MRPERRKRSSPSDSFRRKGTPIRLWAVFSRGSAHEPPPENVASARDAVGSLTTAGRRGWLFEGWGRGRINARSATRGDDRQPTGRLLAFGTKCHPIPATPPGCEGPGIKTWAQKKGLCVRDAEANSERNSHSPPKVVACSWPSESAFAGQPAGSCPVRPDFLPVRRILVRTQASSRSPGLVPLSPIT